MEWSLERFVRPSVRRLGRLRGTAVSGRSKGAEQLHGRSAEWRVSGGECDFEGADLQP